MSSQPLPPVLSLSPFRVSEAVELGVGVGRLRSADLARPFHGVRCGESPRSLEGRCEALLPTLRPDVFFSHLTAAVLWGLPLPLGRADEPLHIVAGWRGDRRPRAGVGSPKETEVRLLLVRAGIREPECNGLVLTTPDGVRLHGDLVWRAEKVVLEYEGDGHRVRRRQWMHDLERYELFQDDGWRVVRATGSTLELGADLVARVSRLLADRAVR